MLSYFNDFKIKYDSYEIVFKFNNLNRTKDYVWFIGILCGIYIDRLIMQINIKVTFVLWPAQIKIISRYLL